MFRKKLSGGLLVLICACLAPAVAHGAATFTTVADSNTLIPGSNQTFAGYGPTPDHFYGTAVSFLGGTNTVGGAYAGVSSLMTLVDTNTTVPGTSSHFGSFGGAAYSNGNFVVQAGASSSALGIYAGSVGGPLKLIADTTTQLPGGSVPFTFFSNQPVVSSTGDVAFIGLSSKTSPSSGGIYSTAGGTLHAVIDTNTIPQGDTTAYKSFIIPAIQGQSMVYGGSTSTGTNLFLQVGNNAPTLMVNQNTAIPGGTGNFTTLLAPSVDGNNIAFFGEGASLSNPGIYGVVNGQLLRIVGNGTAAPGGGTLTNLGGPSISGSDVVFGAARQVGSTTTNGIYLSIDGIISKIVEVGDTVDGRTIASITQGEGFVDSSIPFQASFTDGSAGVYLASVPEPTSMAMMLLPLALAALCLRTRRPASAVAN